MTEYGAFLKRKPPSLVILGNRGMKGIDLCHKIRKHTAGRDITILMVSTFEQTEDEEDFLNAGADNFLHLSERSTPLRGWIAAADRHVNALVDLKQYRNKIKAYQSELDFMNIQLEETLTNANQLAVEAELVYLELDQIFKTAAGGILVIDKKSNVLRYNEDFLYILQMVKHEMKGKKCYEASTTGLCHSPDCPLTQILRWRRICGHHAGNAWWGAAKVAERIRQKFASTTFRPAGDERIQKTVSIGLTHYSPPENEKDLIARADQNMYQAKKSGKNQVIFS